MSTLNYLLLLIWVATLLSGCPGGGSDNSSTNTITPTNPTTPTPIFTGVTLKLLPNTIDATETATLTALLKDSNNAPIANQTVTFSFMGVNSETLSPPTAVTSADGTADVIITDLEKNGGSATVKAKVGEIEAYATVNFLAPAADRASNVQITVTNDFAQADGTDKIILTVLVHDAADSPLAGVDVKLTSDSNSAFFEKLRGPTDENGRFTTTVVNTAVETVTVTAATGNQQTATQTLHFVAHVNAIAISADAYLLKINETATLTVNLTKQTEKSVQIEPLAAPFTVNLSGAAQLLNQPETTDANGRASFQITDSVAEDVTVTVVSGTVSQTLKLYFGATLMLLPVTTNAIGEMTLTALLKQSNGAPLPNQPIQFSFNKSTNETLLPASGITGENGAVSVVITDLGADGGEVIAEARGGTLTAQATVNFLADLGQGRRLETKTSATLLQTNQSATLTATIKDEVGIPVVGQPIDFSVISLGTEPSRAKIDPASGITDANGKVTVTVSDNVAENIRVKISAGTANQEIPLYFGATLNLTPADASGTVGTAVTLTASVNDFNHQGINGVIVNFHLLEGTALLDTFQGTTNKQGQVVVHVTNPAAGKAVIEARADTLRSSATVSSTISEKLQRIELTTNPSAPAVLALNGKATVSAEIWDERGFLVKDGTSVKFTTAGVGTITEQVFTQKGRAEATFEAGVRAGVATITVTSGELTATAFITVESGKDVSIIEVHSVDPPIIGVAGSGISQVAMVKFLVKDNLGNTVVDGTTVTFSLGTTTLGGGETIYTSEESNAATQVSAKTKNGLASVVLKSGLVAGNIDVIAKVGTVSTVARVTIVSSMPDAEHFSLALEYLNIAGGVRFGLLDKVTAYVGDRFGNIVPDGTSVSFITEGGTIGKSVGGGAFTSTTEFGQATAILQAAEPMTPFLGGPAALFTTGTGTFFECEFPYNLIVDTDFQYRCGNPGWTTIVAYTTGSESFVDVNGNGRFDEATDKFYPGYQDTNLNQRWDMSETLTRNGDLSEPFIDGNDNSTFDPAELYIDVNGNGQFDGPDGKYQQNTTIWCDARVLFSARTASMQITSDEATLFTIHNTDSQAFTVNISDIYGNALVAGSRFLVTTTGGVLSGTTDFTLEDSIDRGKSVQFTLSSDLPTWSDTLTRWEYPIPSAATITVQIVSPFSDEAPGGNGSTELFFISGTINVP